MKIRFPTIVLLVIVFDMLIFGCGSEHIMGPTITALPTSTPLPTIAPTTTSVIPGMINGVNIYDILKANEFVYETNQSSIMGFGTGQLWDSIPRFNQDGFLTTIRIWDTGQVRFNSGQNNDFEKAIESIKPVIVDVWGNDILDWISKHKGDSKHQVQSGTVGNFIITIGWVNDGSFDFDITPSNLPPDQVAPYIL